MLRTATQVMVVDVRRSDKSRLGRLVVGTAIPGLIAACAIFDYLSNGYTFEDLTMRLHDCFRSQFIAKMGA